ncbi:MAG: hypothetical protein LBG99_02460 [Propionibacteriaceae bacterium]|jgi:hypothetical protein|nr:hypothetical protein [Propionibacteriaceae bacterium]
MKNRIVPAMAAALLAFGGIGLVAASEATAPEAQAATCYYSNLSTSRVLNVNCTAGGAYGYKNSANASTGYRVGAWVSPGYYSYNPNPVCYAYPTMVKR